MVEVTKIQLALAETKGGFLRKNGMRCSRAHRRLEPGIRSLHGSASHLCIGSFHRLKTQGPVVFGNHIFSHQRGTNFLTAVSVTDQISITVAKGTRGPDWPSSGQCPTLSTNEWPRVAVRSSKTMGAPAIVMWKGMRCQEEGG